MALMGLLSDTQPRTGDGYCIQLILNFAEN